MVAWITGSSITLGGAWLSLAPIGLGVLAWAAIATAVTPLIPNANSAYPLLAATYLPLVLLSGSFGSGISGGEPQWLVTLMSYLPAQPMIDAAEHALGVTSGGWPLPLRDLGVLAGWAIGGLLVSLRSFSWNPRPPRTRRVMPRREPA